MQYTNPLHLLCNFFCWSAQLYEYLRCQFQILIHIIHNVFQAINQCIHPLLPLLECCLQAMKNSPTIRFHQVLKINLHWICICIGAKSKEKYMVFNGRGTTFHHICCTFANFFELPGHESGFTPSVWKDQAPEKNFAQPLQLLEMDQIERPTKPPSKIVDEEPTLFCKHKRSKISFSPINL